MVWIVVYWSREMESSPPGMALFKTKKAAVKYMVDEIKDYSEESVEYLGKYKTWDELKEALMTGEKDQIGDGTYWALEEQTPK